jgi:hypothetical protein
MKLTTDQANQFADYLDGLHCLGDVCDDVIGPDGGQQRYVLPTPEFCYAFDHAVYPYCVVSFNPFQPPFWTHVHYYYDLIEALRNCEDFRARIVVWKQTSFISPKHGMSIRL